MRRQKFSERSPRGDQMGRELAWHGGNLICTMLKCTLLAGEESVEIPGGLGGGAIEA